LVLENNLPNESSQAPTIWFFNFQLLQYSFYEIIIFNFIWDFISIGWTLLRQNNFVKDTCIDIIHTSIDSVNKNPLSQKHLIETDCEQIIYEEWSHLRTIIPDTYRKQSLEIYETGICTINTYVIWDARIGYMLITLLMLLTSTIPFDYHVLKT